MRLLDQRVTAAVHERRGAVGLGSRQHALLDERVQGAVVVVPAGAAAGIAAAGLGEAKFQSLLAACGCGGGVVSEQQLAADALTRIGAERPQLVVFDIYMPDMDGFEFCRRLRRNEADRLRLIAVSGDDSYTTRSRIADCGADQFLSKTEAPTRLVEACEQLLYARPQVSAVSR